MPICKSKHFCTEGIVLRIITRFKTKFYFWSNTPAWQNTANNQVCLLEYTMAISPATSVSGFASASLFTPQAYELLLTWASCERQLHRNVSQNKSAWQIFDYSGKPISLGLWVWCSTYWATVAMWARHQDSGDLALNMQCLYRNTLKIHYKLQYNTNKYFILNCTANGMTFKKNWWQGKPQSTVWVLKLERIYIVPEIKITA